MPKTAKAASAAAGAASPRAAAAGKKRKKTLPRKRKNAPASGEEGAVAASTSKRRKQTQPRQRKTAPAAAGEAAAAAAEGAVAVAGKKRKPTQPRQLKNNTAAAAAAAAAAPATGRRPRGRPPKNSKRDSGSGASLLPQQSPVVNNNNNNARGGGGGGGGDVDPSSGATKNRNEQQQQPQPQPFLNVSADGIFLPMDRTPLQTFMLMKTCGLVTEPTYQPKGRVYNIADSESYRKCFVYKQSLYYGRAVEVEVVDDGEGDGTAAASSDAAPARQQEPTVRIRCRHPGCPFEVRTRQQRFGGRKLLSYQLVVGSAAHTCSALDHRSADDLVTADFLASFVKTDLEQQRQQDLLVEEGGKDGGDGDGDDDGAAAVTVAVDEAATTTAKSTNPEAVRQRLVDNYGLEFSLETIGQAMSKLEEGKRTVGSGGGGEAAASDRKDEDDNGDAEGRPAIDENSPPPPSAAEDAANGRSGADGRDSGSRGGGGGTSSSSSSSNNNNAAGHDLAISITPNLKVANSIRSKKKHASNEATDLVKRTVGKAASSISPARLDDAATSSAAENRASSTAGTDTATDSERGSSAERPASTAGEKEVGAADARERSEPGLDYVPERYRKFRTLCVLVGDSTLEYDSGQDEWREYGSWISVGPSRSASAGCGSKDGSSGCGSGGSGSSSSRECVSCATAPVGPIIPNRPSLAGLMQRYEQLVDNNLCVGVRFGSDAQSAVASIDKKLKSLEGSCDFLKDSENGGGDGKMYNRSRKRKPSEELSEKQLQIKHRRFEDAEKLRRKEERAEDAKEKRRASSRLKRTGGKELVKKIDEWRQKLALLSYSPIVFESSTDEAAEDSGTCVLCGSEEACYLCLEKAKEASRPFDPPAVRYRKIHPFSLTTHSVPLAIEGEERNTYRRGAAQQELSALVLSQMKHSIQFIEGFTPKPDDYDEGGDEK